MTSPFDDGNAATEACFSSLWEANARANAARRDRFRPLAEAVGALAGRRPDLFLAGAGPSLDETLPDLARRRDRLTLVAVDAALRPLLAAGLRPDLVVAVDAQPGIARWFAGLDAAGAPLLAPVVLHPEAVAAWTGPIHLYAPLGGSPTLERIARDLFPDAPTVPAKGNAGHQALLFSAALGPRRILFAGVDFCYPAGRRYAAGVAEGNEPEAPALECLDVEGRPAPTTATFLRYAQAFHLEASASRAFEIVNCGGGILRRLPRARLGSLFP